MFTRHKIKTALLCATALFFSSTVQAASLIRDAEIEDTLRAYGNPIFKEAGLNPAAIHIFIVDDPTLNAFVAGGANMFIHTGLIMKTEKPAMLIGVMAHETGHMAGGHLAQGAEKMKNAQLGSILSMVLGVALAAGGGGDAGMAVMTGGQEIAMRNFLRFSRANESAADQAGLNYLDGLHITSSGMLRVLELLRQNDNRSYGTPDPYTLTHPLSTDRIAHIRDHVMHSTLKETDVPSGFETRHERMIAKLTGFTRPFEETMSTYPASDTSIPAHYARSIAYYRTGDLAKALDEMDALLALKPNDPFFHELRGQFLFEYSRIADSLQEYEKASKLLPRSALILTDYAKVLIASGNDTKAISVLERANSLDNSNVNTWHHLAIAYGKTGNQGMFYLASAEEAMLADNMEDAGRFANLALQELKQGSARLRANDLKMQVEKNKKDKDYKKPSKEDD